MNFRSVVEENNNNIVIMDIFSKLMENRIIFIDSEINEELANGVIAQMLYLDTQSNSPINIYINSPGGCVLQGLAIYDTSKVIKSPIHTYCIGSCFSMGAILLLMGEKRYGLKHSRIMLHQVSNEFEGKLSDLKIKINLSSDLQNDVYNIIREKTSIPNIETTLKDNLWLNSEKALEFGILTDIM